MIKYLILILIFLISAARPAAGEDLLVERLAADFFSHDLSVSQRRAIEAETSRELSGAPAAESSKALDERRVIWRNLSPEARAALLNAKTPDYAALTDSQKQPFRDHAKRRLIDARAAARPDEI